MGNKVIKLNYRREEETIETEKGSGKGSVVKGCKRS